MSSQHERRPPADPELSEEAIRAYLEAHPDFFERHLALLETLRVPHRPDGPAISLVERQLERLRGRTSQAERQLREFVAIARTNEALADKIHALVLELLARPERDARLASLERALHEDFGLERAVLVLFPAAAPVAAERDGFARRIDPADAAVSEHAALLETTQPRCGRFGVAQRQVVFGEEAERIGSLALLPLVAGERRLGLLALGSADEDHFHPGSGTELLQRIADLVAAVLEA